MAKDRLAQKILELRKKLHAMGIYTLATATSKLLAAKIAKGDMLTWEKHSPEATWRTEMLKLLGLGGNGEVLLSSDYELYDECLVLLGEVRSWKGR